MNLIDTAKIKEIQMSGRKKFREMRENGSGRTWGIWNSNKKEFQFGIKAKSPELAEEMLFKKIG